MRLYGFQLYFQKLFNKKQTLLTFDFSSSLKIPSCFGFGDGFCYLQKETLQFNSNKQQTLHTICDPRIQVLQVI